MNRTVGPDRIVTRQQARDQGVCAGCRHRDRSGTDGDREDSDDDGEFELHVLKRRGEEGEVEEGEEVGWRKKSIEVGWRVRGLECVGLVKRTG